MREPVIRWMAGFFIFTVVIARLSCHFDRSDVVSIAQRRNLMRSLGSHALARDDIIAVGFNIL